MCECLSTMGEAQNLLKSVSERSGNFDVSGDEYGAFVTLHKRIDARTTASLLQSCVDVSLQTMTPVTVGHIVGHLSRFQ